MVDAPSLSEVGDVLEHVLAPLWPLPAAGVPLALALGLTLAEDVLADNALPRFDSAAVDGFAIRSEDVAGAAPDAPARLALAPPAQHGRPAAWAVPPHHASPLGAGTPLPTNTDAVAASGAVGRDGEVVVVPTPVREGDNVHPRGSDIASHAPVLTAGSRLGPSQIAAAAAAGRSVLTVHRRPSVTVVVTGDELVRSGVGLPAPWYLHDALGPTLTSLLAAAGCVTRAEGPVPAAHATLRRVLHEAAGGSDLVIAAGGLRDGERGPVIEAARDLGPVTLWDVALAPGGVVATGSVAETPLLAVPGEPAVALVAFEAFVRPAVERLQGRDPRQVTVPGELVEPVAPVPGRLLYLPARSAGHAGPRRVRPLTDVTRRQTATLAAADSWIVVPGDAGELEAGATVDVRPLWPGAW